jgi:hypothetical protein
MGSGESLLARVRLWTGADGCDPGSESLMVRHGSESQFETTPHVLAGDAPEIDEMSVTSFRDYLASPYGFYLRHVLGLREIDDAGAELDPLGFGNLIHDVVRKLGEADIAASADEERIASFLVAHLDAAAGLLFGDDPRAEVWVQLEQARARLRAFAHKQAEWAREGWRIARTEWAPGDRAAFIMVDGRPMFLRGRIDRIDVNPETGAWAVLDYKTGNSKPDMATACTRGGEWRDPQLPLYRHLVAGLAPELGVSGEPMLAWVALPAALAEVDFVEANWSPEDLAGADETIAEVVRCVRRREFGTPGRMPPGEGILGWLCGGLEGEEVDA